MELIWFLSLIFISKARRPYMVNIKAPGQIVHKRDNLSIICKPNISVNQGRIHYIKLKKETASGFTSIAAIVHRRGAHNDSKIYNKVRRGLVSGSIEGEKPKLLYNIPANTVKCSDGGKYQCEMSFIRGDSVSFNSSVVANTTSIQIIVKPTHVNPIKTSPVSPNGRFMNGTTVTLICNGTVGSPARDIKWCYRTDDILYRTYYKSDAFSQGRAFRSGCQYIRESRLTYTVSDAKIDFLCQIERYLSCGMGEVMENYTIRMCNNTDCLDISSSAYHPVERVSFITVLLEITFCLIVQK